MPVKFVTVDDVRILRDIGECCPSHRVCHSTDGSRPTEQYYGTQIVSARPSSDPVAGLIALLQDEMPVNAAELI